MFAVDWLGTGRSGRPPFTAKTTFEAENWFIDSLEKWRAAHGIRFMRLLAHSLGGYLAVRYAQRYPDRVAHLMLISPAGMVSG